MTFTQLKSLIELKIFEDLLRTIRQEKWDAAAERIFKWRANE